MVIDKGAGYQDYQSSRFDGTKGPCFTDGLRTVQTPGEDRSSINNFGFLL
jgi:hypothetical protein